MSGTQAYNDKINNKINKLIDNNNDKTYLKGFRYFLGGLALSSVYDYVSRVNNFMDYANKNPEDLTIDDYTIFLGELEAKGKTASYRIVTYAALKKFSMYLKANQINDRNPMQYVSRPKAVESIKTKSKREKGFLTKKEIVNIKTMIEEGITSDLTYVKQPYAKDRDLAIFTIFLNTGIRCSALCKLDLDDINYDRHSIIVIDKGSKVNEYPLSNDVWNYLMNWIKTRETMDPKDKEALFINKNRGRMGYNGVYDLIKKYTSHLSSKNITPHKLRATYGTQLYKATHDIHFVQKAMGHNSPQTTALYVRGNNDTTKKASEIMNNIIKG